MTNDQFLREAINRLTPGQAMTLARQAREELSRRQASPGACHIEGAAGGGKGEAGKKTGGACRESECGKGR
jgi:hypothetical protein